MQQSLMQRTSRAESAAYVVVRERGKSDRLRSAACNVNYGERCETPNDKAKFESLPKVWELLFADGGTFARPRSPAGHLRRCREASGSAGSEDRYCDLPR